MKHLMNILGPLSAIVLTFASQLKVSKFVKYELTDHNLDVTKTLDNEKHTKVSCGALCITSAECQAFILEPNGICQIGKVVKSEGVSSQGYFEEEALQQILLSTQYPPDPIYMDQSKLMIVGSSASRYTAEFVDLNNTGTTCESVQNFNFNAFGSVGTYIGDKVVVCGGSDNTTSCYEFDRAENNPWVYHTTSDMIKFSSIGIMLSKDRWWITGGYLGDKDHKLTDIYENKTLKSYIPLPKNRRRHNLVRFNDTHIILLGSHRETNETYFFDLQREEWMPASDSTETRKRPQAGFIRFKNGTEVIGLVGGFEKSTGEYMDIQSLTWKMGPPLPGPLYGGCVVQLRDTFLIIGGFYNNDPDSGRDIFKFETDLDEWIMIPQKLKNSRRNTACFLVPDDFAQCI